jgi:hypothetical protein
MSGLAAGCSKGVASDGAVPFGPGPGSSADTDEDDEEEETSVVESNEDSGSGSGGGSESDPILTSGPASTSGDSITVDPTDATTSGLPETTSGVTEPASSSGLAEDSSSSGPPDSTGDTSQTGDACADYAVWAQDCYGYDDGQEWCEYQIAYGTAYYGAACGSAVEELFACLSTQNCGAVGCGPEQTAANNACS